MEYVAPRKSRYSTRPSWCKPNLENGKYPYIDFSGARLLWANFDNANLRYANLRGAHISSAKMRHTDLRGADLSTSRIHKADFSNSILLWADFRLAYLARCKLNGAILWETVLADTDLTEVEGLESCIHNGPSTIDHRTIMKSGNLSKEFLVACGIPSHMAACLYTQKNKESSYHTGFISYSSKDAEFVNKLYVDLLRAGVNVWLDSKQMTPGARILDIIITAVGDHDKLILVCSSNSIESEWVEDELVKAFSEERSRKSDVVVPIRIDDSIMDSNEPWAQKLKDSRYIGDFTEWKDASVFKESFDGLLRSLERDQRNRRL